MLLLLLLSARRLPLERWLALLLLLTRRGRDGPLRWSSGWRTGPSGRRSGLTSRRSVPVRILPHRRRLLLTTVLRRRRTVMPHSRVASAAPTGPELGKGRLGPHRPMVLRLERARLRVRRLHRACDAMAPEANRRAEDERAVLRKRQRQIPVGGRDDEVSMTIRSLANEELRSSRADGLLDGSLMASSAFGTGQKPKVRGKRSREDV